MVIAVSVRRPEERRWAWVLDDGVRLAVRMGGVTDELDLLRRAAGALEDQVSAVDPGGGPTPTDRRSGPAPRGTLRTREIPGSAEAIGP
ncbi:hypothetical protein AB0M20_34130 [Actinoplanes sp. NPDC051633]|uniref:hypothetical protein n=1 Tax=Actinoplanes sp. NPDC051633 TaxID=3155670 RepID=UPI00343092D8